MAAPYVPCEHLRELRSKTPSLIALALANQERFMGPNRAPMGVLACLACDEEWYRSRAAGHAAREGPSHALCLDLFRAELYCSVCQDYVYDPTFDRGVLMARMRSARNQSVAKAGASAPAPAAAPSPVAAPSPAPAAPSPPPPVATVRHRIGVWEALTEHLSPPAVPVGGSSWSGVPGASLPPSAPPLQVLPLPVPTEWPPLGLRGVNNLGNSCFLSSVLQCLLTLPPLQHHFLSGAHSRAVCAAHAAAFPTPPPSDGAPADPPAGCLACELDDAFQAAFTPSLALTPALPTTGKPSTRRPSPALAQPGRPPWSPATLLATWWRSADWMAAYAQQDAHEFFISLLSGAHSAAWRATPEGREGGLRSPTAAAGAAGGFFSPGAGALPSPCPGSCSAGDGCTCIWHTSFGGALRSEVTCAVCGSASVAGDPFLDISLEVPSVRGGESVPLDSCLSRYCRVERMEGTDRIFCTKCQANQKGRKQMCLQRLPPTLVLHLKRFRRSGGAAGAAAQRGSSGRGGGERVFGGRCEVTAALPVSQLLQSSKVDTHISFPLESLDVAPYTAAGLQARRSNFRLAAPAFNADGKGSRGESKYRLSAVVCHSGSLEGGHYTAMVRHGGGWFRCDDAWVTQVSEAEVRACQAYLLFYQSVLR